MQNVNYQYSVGDILYYYERSNSLSGIYRVQCTHVEVNVESEFPIIQYYVIVLSRKETRLVEEEKLFATISDLLEYWFPNGQPTPDPTPDPTPESTVTPQPSSTPEPTPTVTPTPSPQIIDAILLENGEPLELENGGFLELG